MIDKLFVLFMTNPALSMILGAIVLLVALVLFREQLKEIIMKKYGLKTEAELKDFGKYVYKNVEIKNQQLSFKFDGLNDGYKEKEIDILYTNWDYKSKINKNQK